MTYRESTDEPTEGQKLSESKEEGNQAYTAFLVVQRHDGAVVPVTDPDALNVNMHRKATMHDLLRMSADIQEQAQATRSVGEIITHMREMIKAVFPEDYEQAATRSREAREELEKGLQDTVEEIDKTKQTADAVKESRE